MKRIFTRFLLCTALTAAVALAGDVQVIVNNAVSAGEISADDLKKVYLGTKTSLADGSRVEPVLANAGSAHEAFLRQYLGKSDTALRNYYKSLVFTGKGSMPKSFNSDQEVAAYVAKTKGAIGYISGGANAGGAKAVAVK